MMQYLALTNWRKKKAYNEQYNVHMEESQQKVCHVFTQCITTAQNVSRLRDLALMIADVKVVRVLMEHGHKL